MLRCRVCLTFHNAQIGAVTYPVVRKPSCLRYQGKNFLFVITARNFVITVFHHPSGVVASQVR